MITGIAIVVRGDEVDKENYDNKSLTEEGLFERASQWLEEHLGLQVSPSAMEIEDPGDLPNVFVWLPTEEVDASRVEG